jgi:hypothetical protein
MMNKGMEMMMKSFGINPQEIIANVTSTLNQYGAVVVDLKAQMNRMENNQLLIMKHLGIEIPDIREKPAAVEAAIIEERKHG